MHWSPKAAKGKLFLKSTDSLELRAKSINLILCIYTKAKNKLVLNEAYNPRGSGGGGTGVAVTPLTSFLRR